MRTHRILTTFAILVVVFASGAVIDGMSLSSLEAVSGSTRPETTFAPPSQSDNKPRVYVTDSQSWEIRGGFAGDGVVSGQVQGGASPQTAEIIKTLNDKCRGIIVTVNREKANYALILEHEGGKDFFLKDNKYALYKKEGDVIKSGSTRTLGSAVKETCGAIRKDWESAGGKDEKTD